MRVLGVGLLLAGMAFGQHQHSEKKEFTFEEKKDAATRIFLYNAYDRSHGQDPVQAGGAEAWIRQFLEVSKEEQDDLLELAGFWGVEMDFLEAKLVANRDFKEFSKERHKLLHRIGDMITAPQILGFIEGRIMKHEILDEGDRILD